MLKIKKHDALTPAMGGAGSLKFQPQFSSLSNKEEE